MTLLFLKCGAFIIFGNENIRRIEGSMLRKIVKIVGWIVLAILFVLIAIIVAIQIPYVQNKLKDYAITFVEEKIGTPVSLDNIAISFPKKIVVRELYVESQSKDTLFYSSKVGVDISLWQLLNSVVDINEVEVEGLKANVVRDSLQRFNFDYIIEAFATEEETPEEESSFAIAVGTIDLKDIAVNYQDFYEGHHVAFKLHKFETRFKDFDLEEMRFGLPKILIDGVQLSYTKRQSLALNESVVSEVVVEEPASALPQIDLGNIDLSDLSVNYMDEESGLSAEVAWKTFSLDFNDLNIQEEIVDIRSIFWTDLDTKVAFAKRPERVQQPVEVTSANEVEEKEEPIGWKVDVRKLLLERFNVKYDDWNEGVAKAGLDVNHIGINDFNFDLRNFVFSKDNIAGNVKEFNFKEQSGFSLQHFSTYFLYGQEHAFIKDFELKTPYTKVNTSIVLNYLNKEMLTKEIGEVSVDAEVSNTTIGLGDASILMPSIWSDMGVPNLKQEFFKVDVKAKGLVKDLYLEKFLVKGLQSTFVNASGRVKGLPNAEKAYADIRLSDLQTTAKDIQRVAPKDILPKDIEIPALMSLKGFFKGSVQGFNTDLALKTSLGNAVLKAELAQAVKGKEHYALDLVVDQFDVGRLMKNDSIGKVTVKADVKGNSFTPELAQGTASFEVVEASYNGYDFKNLQFDAVLEGGKYQVSSSNKDPNLLYNIEANGQWSAKNLSLNLQADLERLDLFKLKLDTEPKLISGSLAVAMPNVLPDSLVGQLALNNLKMITPTTAFNLKPIVFEAQAEGKQRIMTLRSQVLDFDMEGEYALTTLPDALMETVGYYFNTVGEQEGLAGVNKQQEIKIADSKKQFFTYKLQAKYDPVFKQILPDLSKLEPIILEGEYDQERKVITAKGGISSLVYGDFGIQDVYWGMIPKNNALHYTLGVENINSSVIALKRLNLHGNVERNKVSYTLSLRDASHTKTYAVDGNLKVDKGVYSLSLKPEGFMLDRQNWEVHPDNRIVFGPEGVFAENFILQEGTSSLSVLSKEPKFNSPLRLAFKNFDIATLTKTLQKEKLPVGGILEGFIELEDLSKDFRFIANIDINKLSAFDLALGNLHFGIKNESLSKYLARIILEGDGNRGEVKGYIDADTQEMKLRATVDKLEMSVIEELSRGAVNETEGFFSGSVAVGGTFNAPVVEGACNFNNIGFHLQALNTDFRKINEKISFTPEGIAFDKFSITDSDNNLLVINGQVLTKNYQDFGFNLDIYAVDFKAVNSTVKDNDMYYGTLIFDTQLKIQGDMNKPEVKGQLAVNKKTNFTVVMPQEDPSIADREGIVEFIDEQSLQQAELAKYQENFNNSKLQGLDVSLAILIDKEATFSMIMDKASGDKLIMKGEGDLVGGIDPSGKVTLTGRYEFYEGSYDLSFNMIKRKFVVEKGSSVIFAGDPTDAILDLTAIYETKTAPMDLLQGQLSSLSPSQQNQYKQKLPFEALLKMQGELLKPTISFDIRLKDGVTTASGDVINNTKTKLAQLRTNESELNKQVFALLLLNHFIGENPFESSAGGMSAGAIARQSVNRVLSDQLNNLASSLIQGVELNFNLESSEDFSSGARQNRTDLNVAVSKRLFSERLKVTVGSSFEVEGNQRQNEQANNIAGDIELEYMLSKDGRYLMRVFRKNQYEVALQGQVVETGIGFIITMSYEKFRELFERSKDKRELKKRLREHSQDEK